MEDVYLLSEEDIKLRYITPAILQRGWSVTDITMETQVKLTDGKINLRGKRSAGQVFDPLDESKTSVPVIP